MDHFVSLHRSSPRGMYQHLICSLVGMCVALLLLQSGCTGSPAADKNGTVTADAGDGDGAISGAIGGTAATCATDLDCAVFDDADLCTGVWRCQAGRCGLDVASVVSCATDKDTICAKNSCDKKSGKCALQPQNNGASCEDGNPCTIGDACAAGSCKTGAANLCQCSGSSDCTKFDDDDTCNGTLYCDDSIFPYRCVINPTTVVSCPDGGACESAQCDKKTGKCSTIAKADKTPCDDGDACTPTDRCVKGSCASVGNTCTCSVDGDCALQGEVNLCVGTRFCDPLSNTCKLNTVTAVKCPKDDDTQCSQRLCQPATGLCVLTASNSGKSCDDGDSCTTAETCVGGLCAGGTDTCKCSSDSDCAKAEDGNACNGTLYCNTASGVCTVNPATVITCPSGGNSACLVQACTAKTGACAAISVEMTNRICSGNKQDASDCRFEVRAVGEPAVTTFCEDGDACTVSDICAKGVCKPGTQTCACKVDSDCLKTDDGDLCNGIAFCDKGSGTCKPNPSTVVTCPTVDDTACLHRTCVPKTGKCQLKALKNGVLCEDGNNCTKGDVCVFGQCNPGANTCECQKNSDCLAKDDGDRCNGVPYCDKSDPKKPTCKENPASKVFCPVSTSSCVNQVCNPSNGLCQPQPTAEGKSCDDGTVCTSASACKGGACVATKSLNCDDNNACTLDTCAPKTGCRNLQSNCVDGNSCTTDSCDGKTGICSFPQRLDGSGCDADQSGCTIGDSCKSGVCTAGSTVACKLNAAICERAVCQTKGATAYQCVIAKEADGALCDDGDSCSLQSVCKQGSCVAKPGSAGLFERRYGAGAKLNGSFSAVSQLSGGGYLLGGVIWGAGVASRSWLLRTNVDGSELWRMTQTAKDGKGSGAIVAVLPLSTVAAAVLRNDQTVTSAPVAYLDVVALDGKTRVLTAKIPVKSGGLILADGAMLADGSLLLAGTRLTSSSASFAWAGRLTSTGQVLWSSAAGAAKGTTVHGAGAPAGALVLVGESAPAGGSPKSHAWAAQISAAGKTQWQLAVQTTQPGDRLNAVARAPGGGLLLVGTRRSVVKPRSLLISVTANGNLRWQRNGPNPGRGLGVVGLGDRGMRMVGQSVLTSKRHDLLLLASDFLGNPVFSRTVAGGPVAAGVAVIAQPDHSVVVAGYGSDATSKLRQGLLLRVGAFGHRSCADQGKCAGKTLASCDDGKACTANHCTAKDGCIYPPATGFSCDPADGCHLDGICVDKACKPGSRTRLYSHTTAAIAGTRRWNGVISTGKGNWLLYGQHHSLNAVVERIDATGSVRQSLLLNDISKPITSLPTTIAGAVPTTDGGVILAINLVQGAKAKLTAGVRKLSRTGTPIWNFGTGANGPQIQGLATDLAQIPGTDDVVFVTQKDGSGFTLRLGATGQQVWTSFTSYSNQFKLKIAEGGRTTAVGLSDGGAILGVTLGRLGGGDLGPWQPHVQRINGLGKTVWHRNFNGIGAARVRRLVQRKDGLMVAAGWIPTPAQDSARLWLTGFDITGKLRWQRDHRLNLRPTGVALTPDGGLMLLGTQQTATQTEQLVLAKVGLGGGVRWQRTLAVAGASARAGAWDSVAVASDGSLLVVGEAASGTTPSIPLRIRLDPWGHRSCVEAGTCGLQIGNTSTSSCQDTNPCTIDRCVAKTGQCAFTAAADGLACGDAKVCIAGACKVEPEAMVLIAKGTFFMGCNVAREQCLVDEKPVRKLMMPSFWLHRGEVTSAQLQRCYDVGKCAKPYKYSAKDKDLPANNVTWAAATAYCAYLGGRLPSEAEWAYAAKGSCAMIAGGSGGGPGADATCAAGMPTQYRSVAQSACVWAKQKTYWSYAYGCGNKVLHRAGQASGDRSPWGVLDLMGNLREFTQDYYQKDGYTLDFTKFPLGPQNVSNSKLRVVRGGEYAAGTLDKSYRLSRRYGAATGANQTYGFRCMMTTAAASSVTQR